MRSPQFITGRGNQISLGRELARGGEGVVFEIQGDPKTLAKIYLQGKAADRRDKIASMVAAQWYSLFSNYVAFPIDAVFGTANTFAGFTMRRVDGKKPVHNLYTPISRKGTFPKANFPFLLNTAINISKSVAGVHQTGCVIGDINESGFLIGFDSTATMIDCDSFQVKISGRRFLCDVGKPEFTPPELHQKKFDQVERTFNHDCFGLAVLIFYLLFMGKHPFAGRFLGKGDMPIERAIPEFRFAFSSRTRETQMEPPPNGPFLSDLPRALADAFEVAFGQVGVKARPSAANWISMLGTAEKEIIPCPRNSGHHYFRSASSCPWCRMEQATPGFFAFVPPLFAGASSSVSLAQLIAAIRAVPDPGMGPELSSTLPTIQGPSLQPSVSTENIWNWRYIAGFSGSLLGVCLFQWQPQGPGLGMLLLGASAFLGLQWNGSPFHKPYMQARSEWDELLRKWEQVASNAAFVEHRRIAEGFVQQAEALPREEKNRLDNLKAVQRENQLRRFLERHLISDAKIKGVGSTRTISLRSYGIVTAADIQQYAIEGISGFGPATARALVGWRKSIERRFVFNPSEPINPADIAVIKSDIGRKGAELDAKLRQSLATLQGSSDTIRNARATLKTAAGSTWTKLRQAEIADRGYRKRTIPKRAIGLLFSIGLGIASLKLLAAVADNSSVVINPMPQRSSPPVARTEVAPVPQQASPPAARTEAPKAGVNQTAPTTAAKRESTNVEPHLEQGQAPAPANVDGRPNPESVMHPQSRFDNPIPAPPTPISPIQPAIKEKPALPPASTPVPSPEITGMPAQPPEKSGVGGPYVPAPLPSRSVDNRLDAYWIQGRLRQLGFMTTAPNGVWDFNSRSALRDFKVLNKLSHDYTWDILTEQKLASKDVVRADNSFIGAWSDSQGCVLSAGEPPPLAINTKLARTAGGVCEFLSVTEARPEWHIVARCAVDNKAWIANIKMVVTSGQLVWSSEKGVATYFRCR